MTTLFRKTKILVIDFTGCIYDFILGPNVIMVRTLPHMKLTVTEEQQEKFRLSIANWCLANEGLRKSIQSLQPPASLNNPLSSIISSESLTSICSGLQAIATSGLPEVQWRLLLEFLKWHIRPKSKKIEVMNLNVQ